MGSSRGAFPWVGSSLRVMLLTPARPAIRLPVRMKKPILVLATAALFVAHQDFWWWNDARPLLGGIFPSGLWYHAAHTAASSLLLWALVRLAWPSHLEEPDR